MTGPQFHETGTGHRFYEATLPELVRQITRLADALERAVAALETKSKAEGGEVTP